MDEIVSRVDGVLRPYLEKHIATAPRKRMYAAQIAVHLSLPGNEATYTELKRQLTRYGLAGGNGAFSFPVEKGR